MDKSVFDYAPNDEPEQLNPAAGHFKDAYAPRKGYLGFTDPDRSVEELHEWLQQREQRKASTNILDESGNNLCAVEYDPETNEIIGLKPERYSNVAGVTENNDERVYVTDDQGNITDERLTRLEAREANKRYLIVTTMMFRDDKMLLQKRSPDKKFDPGLVSSSAHGVAKELYTESRERITDAKTASLINAGLETNEELRHDSTPFNIRIWQGTHDELFKYAEEKGLDDPDTVWFVPETFIPESGYPTYEWRTPRTRAVLGGFMFTKNEPEFSIDPNELENCEWKNYFEVLQHKETTDDMPKIAVQVLKKIIQDNPRYRGLGAIFPDHLIKHYKGIPKERTD